jgi:antitoxin VapB
MSERAKLFRNGGSQAVRLPKSCRFADDQEEVLVRRVGKQVVLEPVDDWSEEFLGCLGAWKDDIPRPRSEAISKKKTAFGRS